MAKYSYLEIPASYDLDYINGTVLPQEEISGPLVEIDFNSKMTVLKFKVAPKPKYFATITPCVDGKPDLPDGASLIDEGVIFVKGILVLCAASRPA